jgi:hypothetical protein
MIKCSMRRSDILPEHDCDGQLIELTHRDQVFYPRAVKAK